MGKGINICNTTTNEAIGQLNEFLIKDSQVIDNNLLLILERRDLKYSLEL